MKAQSPDRISLGYFHDPREEARPFHNVIREDRYELHIPLNRGNATVTSDGKLLHKGAVFPGLMRLASPGEEVSGFLFSSVEFVVLSIPGPRLRATVQALNPGHQPGQVCFVNALRQPQFQVEQLGRLLLHAEELDGVHAQLFTDGVADALLACLLSHHQGKPLGRGETKALAPDEFQRVIDFAEAQLEDTLCLKEWAAVLEMSTPAFTRRFRATTGSSPYAWFMQRRLDRSKELLRSTKRTLCDVALSIGFCSQSHFTEAFRRREGTSPARWREAHAP